MKKNLVKSNKMKKEKKCYYYCDKCSKVQMINPIVGPVVRWFCITCNRYTDYKR